VPASLAEAGAAEVVIFGGLEDQGDLPPISRSDFQPPQA
jgi:hypothetical protein